MATHATPEDLIDRTIELAKKLNKTKEEKSKIISLMVVLMDKYLTREKILSIWEEINMLKILEVAEEIYMKKGREQGREEGIEKGKGEFLWRQLSRKFPKIDASYYGKIKKLDPIKLDVLSIEILDMKKVEELDTYL